MIKTTDRGAGDDRETNIKKMHQYGAEIDDSKLYKTSG